MRTTISNVMKMAESSPNGSKTLWEKEKLLASSNFSFSHNVFKRLILQIRKSRGLFGKGLNSNNTGSGKTLKMNAFENTGGKGENADNQFFLLLLQCFQTIFWVNFSEKKKTVI